MYVRMFVSSFSVHSCDGSSHGMDTCMFFCHLLVKFMSTRWYQSFDYEGLFSNSDIAAVDGIQTNVYVPGYSDR